MSKYLIVKSISQFPLVMIFPKPFKVTTVSFIKKIKKKVNNKPEISSMK